MIVRKMVLWKGIVVNKAEKENFNIAYTIFQKCWSAIGTSLVYTASFNP